MAIVAGIDEAGLGPVLGPLVISVAAFEVSDDDLDTSLWRRLSGPVTRRRSRKRRCVRVDDSKVVYSGGGGFDQLEQSVLAFLATLGGGSDSLRSALKQTSPQTLTELGNYPWYSASDPEIPRVVTRESIDYFRDALGRRMQRAGVHLGLLRSEVVFAGALNGLFKDGFNKAEAAFSRVARVMCLLRDYCPEQNLRIYLDRQGGRIHYYDQLKGIFPDAWIWIVEEEPSASRYRIDDHGRRIEVHVLVGADAAQLPTALASMLSKYLREVFMQLLNAFWQERVPGLKSTAGYPLDGKRFLNEISEALAHFGVRESLIRRAR